MAGLSPEEWKRLVLDETRKLADRDYQRKSWLGGSDQISSPVEQCCGLLDDFLLEEFLESTDVGLTPRQRTAGQSLRAEMEGYAGPLDDHRKVFDDPAWQVVRGAAARFVEALTHE